MDCKGPCSLNAFYMRFSSAVSAEMSFCANYMCSIICVMILNKF